MIDLDELIAWLRDCGYQNHADDLRDAAPSDVPGMAYHIAGQIESDAYDHGIAPETDYLPDQLRTWADQEEFTAAVERGGDEDDGGWVPAFRRVEIVRETGGYL